MESSIERNLSKWWFRGVVTLLGITPPALIIYLQDAIASYLENVPALFIVRIIAGLLLTSCALLAFLILQRPWLRWDEPTGTWVSRLNNIRYCGTCRAKKIIVPLKNEITGWRCVACGSFRTDPARKSKEPTPKPASENPRI